MPPFLERKHRKTRWGPTFTAQTAASMFTNDESLDESKVDGIANHQHLEHVVIDNEDSRPKTQLRHIVDSDDGTIEF